MIKLSDYVFKFISGLGVKHVFMLPGGGAMHLVDSLGRAKGIEFVCNLHEQASAIAAGVYGQYENKLGVALVTTGPGGTNAITGVAAAWLDSMPCLFLSGQVKRPDLMENHGVRQMGYQEINIVGLVKPITKYAVIVTDPMSIRYHLEKAVYLSSDGRPGPVWIDIPLDVQAAEIDESDLITFDEKEVPRSFDSNLSAKVSEAIKLFNESERPVILAGNGIRLSGAIPEFLELIEFLQVPVLATWKAIDFLPEIHPLFGGRPGAIGQRGANFTQQNSDWLLTIGARLDFGQTGNSHTNFARAAKKIIVDIDHAEIGKMAIPVDVPVYADAKNFIREFFRQKDKIILRDRKKWLSRSKAWQAKYPVVLPEYRQEKDFVNNYVLIDVLSEELSGEDMLVPCSSGSASEIFMQAFRVKPGMRVLSALGLGAMGFGVTSAIGACLVSGRKRTICIDGDGSFAMNIQELETVKRLNLPIKLFVLNNQGYVSIRNTQRNYFQGHLVASDASSGLTLPDISKIAAAFGIESVKIKSHSGIKEAVQKVLTFKGPVICEVMVSPNQVTSPRITSIARPDGTMFSKPMEDMWPFLSRDEFLQNMIIPPLKGE